MKRFQTIQLIKKTVCYYSFFLIMLLSNYTSLHANSLSQLKIQHFDQKSGLQFLTITDIKQDQLGFIWLSSQDGLSRFDGYSFLNFKENLRDNSTLMDNFIWQMQLDNDHSIWLSTRKGFSHYQPLLENFKNHSLPSSHPDKQIAVSSIYTDDSNIVIIGTAGSGLYQFNKDTKEIKKIIVSPFFQNDYINVFFFDKENDGLWIGSGTNYISNQGQAGLEFYQMKGNVSKSFPLPFKSGINSIVEADKNFLWIATYGDGLWKFEKNTHTFSPAAQLPNQFINTLVKDKKGGLWAGTNSGLFRIKGNIVYPIMPNIHKGDGPGNRVVKSLFLDRSENLWIGTWTDGLYKINLMENGIHLLNQSNNPNGLSGNIIPSVTKFNNELWIAEWKNGIERFSLAGDKLQQYNHNGNKNSLNNGYVRQLHVDNKQTLWVGTTNGLDRYRPETNDFFHYKNNKNNKNSLCGNLILNLTSDENGLWIGTRGGGACFLKNKSSKFIRFTSQPGNKNSLSHNNVSVILPDPPYGIWFGTEGGGLNFYNSKLKTFKKYTTAKNEKFKLTHSNITSLLLDENKVLWIGTQGGGITKFTFLENSRKVNKAQYITKSEGLSSNAISGILEDDNGKVWVGTTKGITSINRSSFKMKYYESEDIYLIGSQYKSPDGTLYFGGTHGLKYFNPDQIKINPYEIPVVLTQFRLNNKIIKPGKNNSLKRSIALSFDISIPHDKNMFTVEFAGLDFQDPENNRYKYRLQGFDENWIDTDASRRFATYTNIPSGEYRLKVIASNNDGVWNLAGRSINIKVNSSPWSSNWALSIYSFIIFALFAYLTWGYRQREELREKFSRELKNKEQRLMLSLWASGNEFWDWEMISGKVICVNKLNLFSLPKNLLNGITVKLTDYIHEKDVNRVNHAYLLHRTNRSPMFECSYRVKDPQGNWIWVLDKGKIVEWDSLGNPTRMSGTLENINAIKSTEERLRIIAQSLEKTSDGVWITDENYNFVFVNESFLKITGQEIESTHQAEFHFNNIENQNINFENHVKQYLEIEGRWQGEIWAKKLSGEKYQQQLNIDSIKDEEGNITHFIGVFSDITHRKNTEKKLRSLVKNDRLTDLLNYTHFLQVTENLITQREQSEKLKFAIIFISIDDFKFINENFGLDVGDQLLVAFAKRLKNTAHSSEALSRFGGDDFVILKDDIHDSLIPEYLTRLRLALTKPYQISNHEINITTSCGIAFFPEHGKQANELFANAHTALNQIKQGYGDGTQTFNDILRSRTSISQQLDTELKSAIANHELELYFQPRVNLSTGEIETIETLLRWNSPKRGMITPNNFLPIAEKTALIFPIGKWVASTLFETLNDWSALIKEHDFAIHLSIEQLRQSGFSDDLKQSFINSGIAPNKIEFIIKDSPNWHNGITSKTNVELLSNMGCSLSLSNFGASEKSLLWLKENILTSVKISRDLLKDLEHSKANQEVIKGLMYTANNMGIRCFANGVETNFQKIWLRENGCQAATGYHFARPLNATDFVTMIQNWQAKKMR